MTKSLLGIYGFISFLTLLLVGYGMISGTTTVNAWNLTAFLWMPLVALAVLLLVLAPVFLILFLVKILF